MYVLGLRSKDAQSLLSELASTAGVHLAASMDHVNTPLLWDKQTAARFNWLHVDATTYASYTLEAAHIPSLLVGRRCVTASFPEDFACLLQNTLLLHTSLCILDLCGNSRNLKWHDW